MGFLTAFKRSEDGSSGNLGWSPFSAHSVSGVDVNQLTALTATTVMAGPPDFN